MSSTYKNSLNGLPEPQHSTFGRLFFFPLSNLYNVQRYEVSTYQFENTLKRKISYYENDLKEEDKKNILNLINQ